SQPQIIEKRRCDRLNNIQVCGSSKLEKAEILQITVDHLKMIHAASGQGYLKAHALTARYLSIVEGWNSVDPLRVHLVSHLNNYASQRHPHWIDWTPWTTIPAAHPPPPPPFSASKLSQPPPLLSSLSAFSFTTFPLVSPAALNSAGSSTALRNQPYRPWGTEIGAF
uniref:Hes related family bHLH transcription factor with YRPW motif 1 n=1 Tax=Oncorhynchus kisutch TaxID=8019 RepID=A0A8C7J6P9_ONCKI